MYVSKGGIARSRKGQRCFLGRWEAEKNFGKSCAKGEGKEESKRRGSIFHKEKGKAHCL